MRAMKAPPTFSPRRSAPLEFLGGVADVVLLLETELVVVSDFEVDCGEDTIVDEVDVVAVVVIPGAGILAEPDGEG